MTAPARVQRLTSIAIAGPAGGIEAVLQTRGEAEPPIAAVVCHPHPLFGGTLHNKVVHRTASTLLELGAAVLRFNFRGVGKSGGSWDEGNGELEDARAALAHLAGRFPGARRWVAGFSFGSWIAARLAASTPAVERMILIAPPVGTKSFEVLRTSPLPKLVVQGTGDEVCSPEALEREFPTWAEPKQRVWVPGATHFFDKQLSALSEALLQGLRGAAAGGTS